MAQGGEYNGSDYAEGQGIWDQITPYPVSPFPTLTRRTVIGAVMLSSGG